MKKHIAFALIVTISYLGVSQAIYKTVYSQYLGNDRNIKILLPRGYSEEDKKRYPVIYVFDADYLFETVAGNVDYFSFWKDMPDVIVVGINQSEYREFDTIYSGENSLPLDEGADFFEFIGLELIPYINNKYKTDAFKVAIGHGKTANFINYFLIRETPIFNAYVAISPDLAPDMKTYVSERLKNLEQPLFYYLATSSDDVAFIRKDAKAFDTEIQTHHGAKFLYKFKDYENLSHYILPTYVLPDALEHIFFTYKPISKKEYKTSILELHTSPVEYLQQKYSEIETLYGIEKQIIINDFKAIAAAIKKKEQWDYYEDLAKVAKQEYPKTLLSNYYLGMYHENMGELKKAIKLYKNSYVLEEIGGITKDQLLDKSKVLQGEMDGN